MNPSRRFVLAFALFMALFPLAVGCFNYRVDPNYRYSFRVDAGLLKELRRSPDKWMPVPANYDDRSLLKSFIESGACGRVSVFGGSRIMSLQPDMLNDRDGSFLNLGITAGTIKDYAALWQLLKENGCLPEKIYLFMDAQSLNPLNVDRQSPVLAHAFADFTEKEGNRFRFFAESYIRRLKDLLSFQTTRMSLEAAGKERLSPRLVPSSEFDGKSAARDHVFTMIYPSAYEASAEPQKVEVMGKQNGEGERKMFRNWDRDDPESFRILDRMIAQMRAAGSEAVLVLMPCHPASLEGVRSDPAAGANLAGFRSDLAGLAALQRVPFYDGFNDTEKWLQNEDFVDGVHLKVSSLRKWARRAL